MLPISATEWGSEEDFARHIVSECCNLQLIDRMGDNLERDMGDLARYFDYEAFGRDLFMYGYTMGANGNVFRVVAPPPFLPLSPSGLFRKERPFLIFDSDYYSGYHPSCVRPCHITTFASVGNFFTRIAKRVNL